MIYGELPTVFPWYDDIRKQNKYKRNSEWSCPFRLITPRDALLPFQIKIPYKTNEDKSIFDKNNPNNIVSNSRLNASDGTFVSDSEYQRTIFIPINPGGSIFITTRLPMSDLITFYDESKIFISGISGNTERSRQLIVPNNAHFIVVNFSKYRDTRASDLLFFSVTRTQADEVTPGDVVSWNIYTESGLQISIDLGINKSKIHRRNYADGIRVFYYGERLLFQKNNYALVDLNLMPGNYYSVIEFENAIYYSEMFTVPNNRFRIAEPNEFMRVDFWNNSDIAPVMYQPGDGDVWRQYVYIDSYVYASDPEIEIDGERDENDLIIPTFQRLVTKYRFSALVPDFLKTALVSIQMHDNIEITTENSIRSGKVDRMTSDTAIEGDGAYSSIDIVFDQYVMTKRSCDENMSTLNISTQN